MFGEVNPWEKVVNAHHTPQTQVTVLALRMQVHSPTGAEAASGVLKSCGEAGM